MISVSLPDPSSPSPFPDYSIPSKTLVDSGSSHCYVDQAFVNSSSVTPYSVSPLRLRYLDGRHSIITQAIASDIRLPSGDVHRQEFYVTPLDSTCNMVLGYSWLYRFNPLIDWVKGSITLRDPFPVGRNSSTPPQSPSPQPEPPVASMPSPSPSSTSALPSVPPKVSLVSAAAFATIIRQKDTVQFTIRAQVPEAQGRSGATTSPPPDLSNLPSEYHDLADVFSEADAFTLPPHRDHDLKIETEDDAVPPIGHIYSLSPAELTALREFIDTNLRSGFIYPSKSSHGAPILFAKKKDGTLRLCVDYRGLNKITRKDRYPLPLIADLLDAPAKARIYTKLDLRHAYHLLRVAPGFEHKTAFRTRYGSYEWRVVPEGLTNAPSAFQRFVNSIFSDMLDVCVVVYLDDILIYSNDPSEHKRNVREVLRRLRDNGLYCKLPKCEFDVTTCEYLGFILSPDGFRMASDKVQTIQDWPTPRKVKDVQAFLGFCNFYRRFIPSYSDITIPLTRLTRASARWDWTTPCQEAFDTLKAAFLSAPVLHHYIPGRQITVETDASDYAIAAILSITGDDGDIHPVAFRSRSLGAAELNYDVHDKELLAIFDAFTTWRHYLEGAPLPVDVVTDHKNLEYFSTTKVLTRRQVRWSEYLSAFNMVIRFRPGRLGGKPDALTRRWDVYAREGDKSYSTANPQNLRPIFTSEHLRASLRATYLEDVTLRASHVMDVTSLHTDILTALPTDPEAVKGLTTANSDTPGRWSTDESGLLRLDNRIYVPRPNGTSDNLRIQVLRNHHDHILAGHYGQNRTLEVIRRQYVWPEVRTFVRDYCRSCVHCKRNKTPRHRPYGLLRPLPVPERPWHSISADFIEHLPPSNGFTSILVVVDRASKQGVFIPCHDTITSQELAQLFLVHVFSKHGVPSHVTSDRGSEFVSIFMRSLGELLNVELHFTSGHHPQADGQTERMNQTLEQYLRMYCSYQQDDWDRLLAFAEFAYNNAVNASTGMTPFYANKGYHPSITIQTDADVASTYARDYAGNLHELHERLREAITAAQERYKETADRVRAPAPPLAVGDQAYVLAKFISSTRPTAKLSEKYLGPYEIIAQPSASSYTLRLPKALRSVHPVFHVSQLEPHFPNPFPERSESPPPPIEVDDDIHYEVKAIVDSKLDRRYRQPLRYYVEWLGYEGTSEQFSWVGVDDIGPSAPEIVAEFHRRYPSKPGPTPSR